MTRDTVRLTALLSLLGAGAAAIMFAVNSGPSERVLESGESGPEHTNTALRVFLPDQSSESPEDERSSVQLQAPATQHPVDSASQIMLDSISPTLFVRQGEAVITSARASGFYSIKLPMLAPVTSTPRQFYVFGALAGQEPVLVDRYFIEKGTDIENPLLLNLRLFEQYEQIVVTSPRYREEAARIILSVSRDGLPKRLFCPNDTPEACTVLDYSAIGSDGVLFRQLSTLEPGLHRMVQARDVGLVFLSGEASGDTDSGSETSGL